MRERTTGSGRALSHRRSSRGGARTMLRWLLAVVVIAAAGTGVAAWTPPAHSVLVNPHSRRHTESPRHIQLLGWNLELYENRAIRSPYYDECLFYRGKVLGEERSTASVTECRDQLYGLIQVGDEDFVLQPTREPEGAHVLRRRDVVLADQPPSYNLTGDTVDDLDLDFEEDDELLVTPYVRSRNSDHFEKMEYFRSAEPITRPMSGVRGLWLEMAIVADHTMMKFHGRERVKHYILALMNIVSAIFNDPSLNSNMTLVINKLFLYEEKDSVIKFGDVRKSLEAVNKWNYRHLIKLPSGTTAWDATIWLTRSPLGGPSGFAPVGGVCSRTRSAAIDRDEGLTSAFVIAHELGHLLGLTHDGEDQCQSIRGSVMSPTVLATLHNYVWSSCSKDQFHAKSVKWWCLQERSSEAGVELGGAKEVSNYVFTMDEQCRTEFGEGFSVCKTVNVRSACSRLWCAHRALPNVCRSKRAPPLEGTPCGHNRWCVDRVCEPMPGHRTSDRKVDEKPQWEEWGRWSECGADCGYGLRSRVRRCRYRDSPSEQVCSGAGAASQAAVCWAGRSCAAHRDMRADLCSRQHPAFIPYLHPNETKHCEVMCVDYKGGEASNFGALPDGTPCSYDRPFDICFQGTCVKGQCNATDAACNWCPDGYCNNNTHIHTRRLGREWSRMTVIPHEARRVSVRLAAPVPLRVALRERKRDKHVIQLTKHAKPANTLDDNYLKYDPNVPQNLQIVEVDNHVIDIKDRSLEGEVVAAGSLLRFRQTDTDVFITSTARLYTDLMIMATPKKSEPGEDLISVTVYVNYSTPASFERARPLEYRWSTSRGPCSVSCGGGVRAVRPRCLRDAKCPPTRYEACNTHSCEFTWSPGEWEECSSTCGGEGVQERQLFCVPANVTTRSRRDLIRHSVSPALCPSLKPDRIQPCNRIQCPVYWREMPWTPCSTTCGRGISRRPLVCPASDDALCGPKPRERRRRCRLRRCSPSRLTLTCSNKDTTQYCELFTTDELRRNCMVPPFRKYCCNTCKNVDTSQRRS